jgi:hypothetical protein
MNTAPTLRAGLDPARLSALQQRERAAYAAARPAARPWPSAPPST